MGELNFVKEALLNIKLEIDANTLIVGDFNTLLTSRQIILGKKSLIREILELYDIVSQMYITDIYRIFHTKMKEYPFCSSVLGTSSNYK